MTDLANNRRRNHQGRRANDDNGDDNGNGNDDQSEISHLEDDIDDGDHVFIEYGQHLEENYLGQKTRNQYSARVKSIVNFLRARDEFRERFLQVQADGSYKITSALSNTACLCWTNS